jgi:hypothetical protein
MHKLLVTTFSLAAVLLAGSAAADPGEWEGAEAAKRFWAALAAADFEKLPSCYTPEVLLMAGSELLKPEWEVHPEADRSKDLRLSREQLIAGYHKLIGRVGQQRWTGLFTKIDPEKISFRRVGPDEKSPAGVVPGDLMMTVATGPGDDRLTFVLRRNEEGRWLVVAERTDY